MNVINHLDYQIFSDNHFNIDLGQYNNVTGTNNLCTGNSCTVSGDNVNTTTKYTITDYVNATRVITCSGITAPAGTILKVVTPNITFITKSTGQASTSITLLKELDVDIDDDTWYVYIVATTSVENTTYTGDIQTDYSIKNKLEDLSVNCKAVGIIPAGYIVKFLIIENLTTNAITLNIGTTDGGVDLGDSLTVGSEIIYTATVNKLFSFSDDKDIFIKSSDWNSASINIYLLMEAPANENVFETINL